MNVCYSLFACQERICFSIGLLRATQPFPAVCVSQEPHSERLAASPEVLLRPRVGIHQGGTPMGDELAAGKESGALCWCAFLVLAGFLYQPDLMT